MVLIVKKKSTSGTMAKVKVREVPIVFFFFLAKGEFTLGHSKHRGGPLKNSGGRLMV
jgi:hypothetical protein